MWGDIAYQLGGAEGYRMVEDADRNAANPGESLVDLFKRYGPVMILIDEWVAYARGLPMSPEEDGVRRVTSTPSSPLPGADRGGFGGRQRTAGGFGSRVERSQLRQHGSGRGEGPDGARAVAPCAGSQGGAVAACFVRGVLRDRPASSVRTGGTVDGASSGRGGEGLPQPLYGQRRGVPVGDQGARLCPPHGRRLSDPSRVVRPALPGLVYVGAVPADPGVLRLMASVISVLWDRDDRSLMIMPGVVPMDSAKVVPELTRYLTDQWKPIIDADVDGPGSLPCDSTGTARTWAGTGPAGGWPVPPIWDRRPCPPTGAVSTGPASCWGCVQPGERPGVFSDALRHLADEATYLYNQQMRYWYDTKPSLTRLAADRALSRFEDDDADEYLHRHLDNFRRPAPLGGVHVFRDSGDVPDEEDSVRLVILHPRNPFERGDTSPAAEMAQTILDERRGGRRINRNMLVFLAAEKARVPELRQAIRSRLAWKSILDERGEHDLNLTPADVNQARTRLEEADRTVDLRIGETFSQVLYPVQAPGQAEIRWSSVRVGGSAGLFERVVSKLESSQHLIAAYAGTLVRRDLDRPDAPLWTGTISASGRFGPTTVAISTCPGWPASACWPRRFREAWPI